MRNFLFSIALLISNILFAQKTILHCGKLIDVKELKILTEMSVVVEGNKVVDVKQGYFDGAID